MKTAAFAIVVLVSACAASPESKPLTLVPKVNHEGAGVLRVNVHGVTPRHGKVVVAVYDRAENFLKANREAYLGRVDVTGDSALVVVEGVAAGSYACAVIDDVDSNGTLSTNLVGYPTEPFGFSNDARVNLFGPPDFDDAKFEFHAPETKIDITLR